jgi:MFS family permease
MPSDVRAVLAAQALRAFGYGLTSVLLGVTLQRLGFSGFEAGLVFTAVIAGTVFTSLVVARAERRFGRRRCYFALYLVLGVAGALCAYARSPWLFVLAALTGALSTEVMESGPFTSLEQAMLAEQLRASELTRGFGVYNAVAAASGSLGALAAGLPPALRRWFDVPAQRWFLLLVGVAAAGALVALRLSVAVEHRPDGHRGSGRLDRSRPTVVRLAGLFALDSFGGGFIVQSFIAFWFAERFGASVGQIGAVFFVVGILQTISLLVAPVLARRFGLLPTMVATHLPSNLLLVAIAFAPSFAVAVGLLWLRVSLSQMDVPTRQAYVMTLVDPSERVASAAYTNTARYVVRPAGPTLAGAAQTIALGAPFVIAGAIKSAYDGLLWAWFRRVPVQSEERADG